MAKLATAVGIFILGFLGTAVIGLLSKWFDRMLTARVQWRVGPPWYQPIADLLKLMGKETIVPDTARKTGFLLAPLAGLAGVGLASAILWSVNVVPGHAFVGDFIVVWYLLMIPSLAFIIGGAASGNPHGTVGASREMKVLLAYELPFLLAVITAVVARGGSFNLGDIMKPLHAGPWALAGLAIASLVALFCVQAKLGLVPFDVAEAETEIMSGIYVEYSGAALGVVYLTRAMMTAALPIFLVTVFWGGFSFSGLNALWSVLKYVGVLAFTTLVRNTNPRLRVDQIVRFFWFQLTPIAIIAVVMALAGR